MPLFGFVLILLFSIENHVFADIPVGTAVPYYPQPITDNQNHSANQGTIQQWNGSLPTVQQQPNNIEYPQEMRAVTGYNSEDYDGEQYEDNRLRLMLNPKKSITLNETNLRTWKANPVTNTAWQQFGVTEPMEPIRRSAFNLERENSLPDENTDSANSTTANQTQILLEVSTSNSKDFRAKLPVNNTQTFTHSLNDSIITQTSELGDNFLAATVVFVPNDGKTNITEKIGQVEPISKTRSVAEFNFTHDHPMISNAAVAEQSVNGTRETITMETGEQMYDNHTETAYVDIDTDYVEEEHESDLPDDIPDLPDGNAYVIVLPGMKGTNATTRKNIFSGQEIISENLTYMLSNLTAKMAINERSGIEILRELREQKTQLNAVTKKINTIYDLLKKQNQDS